MDLKQAIEQRISRRSYLQTPIKKTTAESLQTLCEHTNEQLGLRVTLVQNNGAAFAGLRRSYGMFSGVENYFAMIGKTADPNRNEKLGYCGERLVLAATVLGLGTCWVGGTYDRKSCPVAIQPDEMLECVIAVGNVFEEQSTKERLIYKLAHRTGKTPENLYQADAPVPDWFSMGMKAVGRAPSALCRRPTVFSYRKGQVRARVPHYESHEGIDLGIAKLHFEIGAGGGDWEWGNNGPFYRSVKET